MNFCGKKKQFSSWTYSFLTPFAMFHLASNLPLPFHGVYSLLGTAHSSLTEIIIRYHLTKQNKFQNNFDTEKTNKESSKTNDRLLRSFTEIFLPFILRPNIRQLIPANLTKITSQEKPTYRMLNTTAHFYKVLKNILCRSLLWLDVNRSYCA